MIERRQHWGSRTSVNGHAFRKQTSRGASLHQRAFIHQEIHLTAPTLRRTGAATVFPFPSVTLHTARDRDTSPRRNTLPRLEPVTYFHNHGDTVRREEMASGGHLLAAQRQSVEARIKSLLNVDLKEICRAWGYPISGNKVHLQKRCMESKLQTCVKGAWTRRIDQLTRVLWAVLDDTIIKGDTTGFENLKYRVAHSGHPPPPHHLDSPTDSFASPPTGFQQRIMTSARAGAGPTANRLPTGGRCSCAIQILTFCRMR